MGTGMMLTAVVGYIALVASFSVGLACPAEVEYGSNRRPL
jgi:hypothetical protein